MKSASTLAYVLAAALLLPLGSTFGAEKTASDQTEQAAATTDTADSSKKAHRAKATDHHRCTSSRIRKDKAVDCEKTATPTRTYTQEDIQQTGETDVGQALRKLDPRFN